MKKQAIMTKFLLCIGSVAPVFALPLVAASCNKTATITLNSKAKESFEKYGYHVKGSALDFNKNNYSVSNPISPRDSLYKLTKNLKDEKGNPIYFRDADGNLLKFKGKKLENGEIEFDKDANGNYIYDKENGYPRLKEVLNNELEVIDGKPVQRVYREFFSRFLDFNNISPNYDFRVFSFTWEELINYFPATKNDSRYWPYRDNPRALFLVLYWTLKQNEAAPNWKSDFLDPSIESLLAKGKNRNVNTSIEEAPWPFYKGIMKGNKDAFWSNASEPITAIFEKS